MNNYELVKYINDTFDYVVKSNITKKEAALMAKTLNEFYKNSGNISVTYKPQKIK